MKKATQNRRSSRRMPPLGNVRATCRKGALDLGPDLALGVLDLSETGVRLLLRARLPAGAEVALLRETAASGKQVKRLALVAWCVATEGGGSCAGLRFEKPLPYADLDRVARF